MRHVYISHSFFNPSFVRNGTTSKADYAAPTELTIAALDNYKHVAPDGACTGATGRGTLLQRRGLFCLRRLAGRRSGVLGWMVKRDFP